MPGVDPVPVFQSILLIWRLWILVMITCAVRAAGPTPAARRRRRAIGTTVPLSGFAAVQIMVK